MSPIMGSLSPNDDMRHESAVTVANLSSCIQVLFVDPADKFCGELLKLAEAFYVHNAPVR